MGRARRRLAAVTSLPEGELARQVGVVHLLLAAVGNALVGGWLLAFAVAGEPFASVLWLAARVFADDVLLQAGPSLGTAASVGVPAAGVALLLLATLQSVAVRTATRHSGNRRAITAGAAGLWNPLVIPPTLVSIALLLFARSSPDA